MPIPVEVTPQQMSFWKLVENNPEWVGALATILFGAVTAVIIAVQVVVMRAQTRVMHFQANIMNRQRRDAERLMKAQNVLIRWQHEHEWLQLRNRDRLELIDIVRELWASIGALTGDGREVDKQLMVDTRERAERLRQRMSTLDVASYSSPIDEWFYALSQYTERVTEILAASGENSDEHAARWPRGIPTTATVEELRRTETLFNVAMIVTELESSIRVDYLDFKRKWDKLFPD
jgi:hypothetical protein